MARIIFFLIDGFSDLPRKDTPLRLASKKFLESLKEKIWLGKFLPLEKKYWPKYGEKSITGLANLGILGYKIKPEKLKRGPLEAIGSEIEFKNGELALRIDFASVDENLRVIDRRSGRNTFGLEELSQDINKQIFSIPFHFHRTYGHRGVLIFKTKLSPNISDSDPYKNGVRVKKIKPLRNNKLAKESAKIVWNFLIQTYNLLKNHHINQKRKKLKLPPANFLLSREAGNKIIKLKNFFEKYKIKNGVVIAENGVVKGGCILSGFKAITLPEIENLEERYKFYEEKIKESFDFFELIYLHLKEADEASHDKNPLKKKKFFEFFDKWFSKIYDSKTIFIVTGDHITDSKLGKHLWGYLPIIIINHPLYKNNPKEISEIEAYKNEFLSPQKLWKIIEKT